MPNSVPVTPTVASVVPTSPVERALWFVEANSRRPLSLDDIAAACCVSPYHLTRAFTATTGTSLMRYVRARRLTEAAKRLADGAEEILALALDAGYGSHEAFTRAFREHFGVTPESVRARRSTDSLALQEALVMRTIDPASLPALPAPRILDGAPLLLAGIVERYDCQDVRGIPDQWQRFTQGGRIAGQVGDAYYGISDAFDANGWFDYWCAVEVRSDAALPRGWRSMQVGAGRWAVFHHTGHIAAIRDTIAAVWNVWLPSSGERVREAPTLERYGPEFDARTGLGGMEFWVPLE